MSEELNELQHIARAAKARELQENPILQEAVESWKKELNEAWISSPARDQEGREKLYLMVHAANKFQAYLQRLVETGQIVQARNQGLYNPVNPGQ